MASIVSISLGARGAANRTARRILAILLERHAGRADLGPTFHSVTVRELDGFGDPVTANFSFNGGSAHSARENVANFIRPLKVLAFRGTTELQTVRTVVLRRIIDLHPEARTGKAASIVVDRLTHEASRASLGPHFIEVVALPEGVVGFAFAKWGGVDEAAVERVAEKVRSMKIDPGAEVDTTRTLFAKPLRAPRPRRRRVLF